MIPSKPHKCGVSHLRYREEGVTDNRDADLSHWGDVNILKPKTKLVAITSSVSPTLFAR